VLSQQCSHSHDGSSSGGQEPINTSGGGSVTSSRDTTNNTSSGRPRVHEIGSTCIDDGLVECRLTRQESRVVHSWGVRRLVLKEDVGAENRAGAWSAELGGGLGRLNEEEGEVGCVPGGGVEGERGSSGVSIAAGEGG